MDAINSDVYVRADCDLAALIALPANELKALWIYPMLIALQNATMRDSAAQSPGE